MDSALDSLLKTQPSLWRGRQDSLKGSFKGNNGQHAQQETIDTGFPVLNSALPGGGWNLGTLTELLVEHEGCGELSLLLPALKTITQQQQWTALVNPPHIPYAPALSNAGISLDRMLIVDSNNDKDALWATEQLLRSGLFTVVVCWLQKTGLKQQRRLQLAAETGRALAIAYRPTTAAADHSAAAFRLSLSTQSLSTQSLSMQSFATPLAKQKEAKQKEAKQKEAKQKEAKQKEAAQSAATHSANPNNNQVCEPLTDKTNQPGMKLNMFKSRGGALHELFIQAQDFDTSQGAEWPGHLLDNNRAGSY